MTRVASPPVSAESLLLPMAPQHRLSGLQRQILSLYRSFLRVARTKPPDVRSRIEKYVGAQFRHDAAAVDKKDFQQIEYLVRRATKQLESLRNGSITGFQVVDGK
ncbi:hypothetical protein KP509_20G020500 [Ceratopteris richardii]|uniref:Complex 1 LYR protein domain-containing protein n=1 Tax=Ceratopteris richardii TaxID=49495 RepID=A0A8T2SGY4_CERRI|nr:hypothetical protein KP509_20G020500 [Ceratopteris richardii]